MSVRGRLGGARRWLVPAAGVVATLVLLVSPRCTAVREGEGSGRGAVPARSETLPGPSRPATQALSRAHALPGEGPDLAAAQESGSESLDCVIEPHELVEIGSPVRGVLEQVHVERGDLVDAGQPVAELESAVERAQVELARAAAKMEGEVRSRQARLALGERKQARAELLFEREALSLDLRDEIETESALAALELRQAHEKQRLAQLELERAIATLERRRIHSPISGVVVERRRSVGEMVDQDTILTVAEIDPLRVEVILPSARFGSVRTGMRAAVVPEQPGDRVHVAQVAIVDRVVDAASGTFGVRLLLPNPDHAIPSGLHCQVRFLEE